MRKAMAAGALALALFSIAYMGSAYVAVQTMRDAARTGDKERLEQTVDFPAVRESIKAQLGAAMMKRLQSDPDMKGNPFAKLGAMLAPMIVDRAVDLYVTPDSIAAMVKTGKAQPLPQPEAQTNPPGPLEAKPDAAKNDETHAAFAFASLDRFKATFVGVDAPTKPIVMTMERRGLFNWRLVRIDLPIDEAIAPS